MRSLLRIVMVATVVCLFVSARPASAGCEGGNGVPTEYEITIRYYNAAQQPVGFEIYYCGGAYVSRGTLSGQWIEETDVDCCTGQSNTGYFYLCPDGIYHTVSYIGDTNCS